MHHSSHKRNNAYATTLGFNQSQELHSHRYLKSKIRFRFNHEPVKEETLYEAHENLCEVILTEVTQP